MLCPLNRKVISIRCVLGRTYGIPSSVLPSALLFLVPLLYDKAHSLRHRILSRTGLTDFCRPLWVASGYSCTRNFNLDPVELSPIRSEATPRNSLKTATLSKRRRCRELEYSCTAPSADYGCTQIPVPQTPPIAQRFQRHSRWFSGSMDAVGPGGYFPLGRSLPSATSASQQRATPFSPLVHSSVTSAAALTASRALAIATPRPAGRQRCEVGVTWVWSGCDVGVKWV